MKVEYFTDKLAANTEYKLIKKAAVDGTLVVLLFARDNGYLIQECPNQRLKSLVIKEMARILPGSFEIKQ